jgi:hypothetical protein
MRAGRRLAGRIARAGRAIDRRVGRLSGRAQLLVEARTPMNLAVLQPVFTTLLHDPRVDVWFTGVDRDDLNRAFTEAGVRDRVLPRGALKWRRFDLYINADPWETARLRRVARRLNFFHGVAGKYDLDCPTSLPLALERYDRVAFPNESRMQGYLRAGLVRPEQAALVGYPKVDVLANSPVPAADAARALGLDASRPTAIFAPTFSPASALHDAGETIVETLLGCGCNVIAKLHDRSLDDDPRYNGGVNWRERLQRFTEDERFLLARGGDSNPYVMAADLMVSDHSSIAFEFCVLDRPVIVYDAPRLAAAARINPEKIALLRSAATVVGDAASLARAVRAALAAPDASSAARRRLAAEVFYRPGSASDRARRLTYELLDLPPLSDVVGEHRVRAWSIE